MLDACSHYVQAGGLLFLSTSFAAGVRGHSRNLPLHLCIFLPISGAMQLHIAQSAGIDCAVVFAFYFAVSYAATKLFITGFGE